MSKETIIKVTEPTIQLNKSNATIYAKANLVLNATIKGKDTKAVFISSDQSIATVDENGKVTGVKAGSTTKKTVTNSNTGKQQKQEQKKSTRNLIILDLMEDHRILH